MSRAEAAGEVDDLGFDSDVGWAHADSEKPGREHLAIHLAGDRDDHRHLCAACGECSDGPIAVGLRQVRFRAVLRQTVPCLGIVARVLDD